MEMSDQYGMADLRHLMNGRPHFSSVPPPQPPTADLFSGHAGSLAPPTTSPHFEMLMMGSQIMPSPHPHHFTPDYPAAAAATEISTAAMDLSCGGEGGTGRWPRQETLTLLEIRSRLDFKFKEANHKGPLWDEISRIMCEENGYQRSGKKCREKFENLYKYYKKTKEGKAGRQDGKHYRFFRQLEALYGGDSTSASAGGISHHPYIHTPTAAAAAAAAEPSLSLSSSFDQLDTSSSDESGTAEKGIRKRRRSWKTKVREFIDSQMRRLMEKQEQWLEKMLATLEHKERERMARDEEWRNRETARMEKESELWANERAWIKARDAALFEALQKLSGDGQRDQEPMVPPEAQNDAANRNDSSSSSPPPPSNPNRNPNPNGVVVHDGCFRFLMADGRDNLWENYELKDENR